eukprot:CAMPEP_0170084740 /NCGR_PEP_ID=MMETSP0019_2-20121128/19839_1 /TAXON_ID=98059 /ORGANISM="Dinobryon sp., Strain UTEXLB2267" /LENGTH=162 /DNA_ID=CAMNT_0010300935 /DNA_START=32 /DNA_END=520 /DNA_ORIENTATION=+
MTEEEKVQLAALNRRVFGGEELAGQVKELHDHLKAKDRAILPAPGTSFSSFPFTSTYLAYIGMDKPVDQYALYGTSLLFIGGSFKPLRKAYYLNKYIHEEDTILKAIWALRGPFTQLELDGGDALLKQYKRVPRNLSALPVSFIVYAALKKLYQWLQKQKNA